MRSRGSAGYPIILPRLNLIRRCFLTLDLLSVTTVGAFSLLLAFAKHFKSFAIAVPGIGLNV